MIISESSFYGDQMICKNVHHLVLSSAVIAVLTGIWLSWDSSRVGVAFPQPGMDCTGRFAASTSTLRVFNDSTLALHSGVAEANGQALHPLLLVVLGEVFDVSDGAKFYARPYDPSVVFGKDAIGYNIFVGRDSSRSFASGDFVHPRADLEGLSPSQVNSIVEWRSFYRNHKSYRAVGVHAGVYYDCFGEASDALRDVDSIATYAKEAAASEAAMLAQFDVCNSMYRPQEKFSMVSCPASPDEGEARRVPRRLFWRSMVSTAAHVSSSSSSTPPSHNEAEQQRCVCITLAQEKMLFDTQPPASVGGMRTEHFDGCDSSATSCTLVVK